MNDRLEASRRVRRPVRGRAPGARALRARSPHAALLLGALLLAAPAPAKADPGAEGVLPAAGPLASDTLPDLQAVVAALEPEIRRAMVEGRIPSLTIALTVGEEIVWMNGYGESNLRARTPATPETVYIIASTFKTMGATALLQLMDEGHFELDDPVRDHLRGLPIPGEDPARPITFRHLLTHTSGLPTIFSGVPVWADTVPLALDDYLSRRLRIEGPPGERVRYSNMGYTLIARLVEDITGEDFRDVVRERIFAPLGMESTDFAPTPAMEELLAVPYQPHPETGAQVPAARVRFAEWPAGGVWGTVENQARWLIASLNGGSFRGHRILRPETAELMQTRQYDRFTGPMTGGWGGPDTGYGLAWWTTTRNGERYIAHSGSVRGYTAFIHGNRDRRLGVAILTNGQRAHPHLVRLSFLATDLMAGTRVVEAGSGGR